MQVTIRRLILALALMLSTTAWANTTYVVKEGDYLGKIAAEHNCRVADIIRWNPSLDPDRIQVGQKILIRKSTATSQSTGGGSSNEYTVQSGDTMTGIASKLGVSYNALLAANRNVNPDRISVGQRLRVPTGSSASSGGDRVHEVVAGDTISAIAARYGVSIQDLESWNSNLNPDRIQIGQKIKIRGGRAVREISYTVVQGDIVGRIAERHNVTVAELNEWNPKLDPDRIRIGQKLRIFQEGPKERSESYGSAHNGRLVNGEQLPTHSAYTIRSTRRAWGTNQTISNLMAGYDHMHKRYSNLPRVSIHDLSKKDGGKLKPHLSHQTGRDADIGYYHTRCGRRDCEYRVIRASELNAEYQWALFEYWIDNDHAEYIFMDYTLQETLYNYAKEQGVSSARLSKIFQYPRGRHTRRGIIRHEPGHQNHFHVRFRCSSGDRRCR